MSVPVIVVIVYMIVTFVIGIMSHRKSSSSASFHGAGLGVFLCVAAGTGEWLGGTATTGVSEYGYDFGISGAWYTIANGVGIAVLAIFFAKLYRSLDTVTVPGIIGRFIGVKARTVSSIMLTFVMLAVGTSQMVAIGTLGVNVFQMDYVLAVVLLGVGVIIYTLFGGMNAVAQTNIFHLFTMYFGMILAIVLALKDIGGVQTMRETLPESYFSFSSIGLSKISSWLIASILGACTAQAGIQPILAAKDTHTAKKAAYITAITVAPFGLFTAFLGMIAKVKYPDLSNAKNALPQLMLSLSPLAGGIVLSAILAAVLSTISPIMLASGTMLTNDIYKKIRPDADEKKVLFVSRATTAIAGIICILIAVMLYDSSRLLDIVYFAYTIRGSLFVVLLFGIYWKGTTEKGAIGAMFITAAVGLFWVIYKALYGQYPISANFNETYASVIAAAVSTFALSLIGNLRAKKKITVTVGADETNI